MSASPIFLAFAIFSSGNVVIDDAVRRLLYRLIRHMRFSDFRFRLGFSYELLTEIAYDANGQASWVTKEYLYIDGRSTALKYGKDKLLLYDTNLHGDITALVDDKGIVVNRCEYRVIQQRKNNIPKH